MTSTLEPANSSEPVLKKYAPTPNYWATFSAEKVSAMNDADLLKEMCKAGGSHCWMGALPRERILNLLQGRFESLMTKSGRDTTEERIRRRLGCVLLREQLLSSPFYAERDKRLGEPYWINSHLSCFNV